MKYTVALVGNQNCGKSSLFNCITGKRQHVGNFPGVTVERKEGILKGTAHTVMIDLPGCYSLLPYTEEEKITRDYLFRNCPDLIINVINPFQLKRSLSLTLQLKEAGFPVIAAVNMMDEIEKQGIELKIDALAEALNIPVFPISAAKNIGINNLMKGINFRLPHSFQNSRYQLKQIDFSEKAIYKRHQKAKEICRLSLTPPSSPKRKERELLDKIFLHPVWGLPIFGVLLSLIFFLSFSAAANASQNILAPVLQKITGQFLLLLKGFVSPMLLSILKEAVFPAIFSLISFLPTILLLFFLLSLLEDSGYMARAVFLTDGVFEKIGLSGKSLVPLLLGFGCSVPGIMSVRTLPQQNERKLTALMVPFFPCSARIPVYALLISSFFPKNSWIFFFFLYAIGIIAAIWTGFLLREKKKSSKRSGFLLELPPYRLPTIKNALLDAAEKALDFCKRIFGAVVISALVIWLLQNLEPTFRWCGNEENSLLAWLSQRIAPLFAPLGFGDWKVSAALCIGLSAKEAIVSTFSVLLKGHSLQELFSPASACSFLTFTALYSPCISSLAAVKKDFGWKTAFFSAVYQTAAAYLFSFLIYRLILFIA